eukprot:3188321-Rhodomonas_salina.1
MPHHRPPAPRRRAHALIPELHALHRAVAGILGPVRGLPDSAAAQHVQPWRERGVPEADQQREG